MPTDESETTPTEPEVTVDYKKQYETAQRASEKSNRAHEATLAQLNAEKHAHENTKASIENLKAEIQNLTTALGQKDGTLTTLHDRIAELEPVRVKAMRLEVIMSDFPHLASFEKDGLLPAGETPEILRESLTKFSDRLAVLSKANEANFASGGKPENVPAPEQKKSSSDLAKEFLNAAVQAQRNGNMSDYELNYTKFLQEKNKQQA
jgi:predicted RNase H-like nuclease (RuvC/YqgF family)